jgi:hypothetical protein
LLLKRPPGTSLGNNQRRRVVSNDEAKLCEQKKIERYGLRKSCGFVLATRRTKRSTTCAFFADETWQVRYLVVKADGLSMNRVVLIAPLFVEDVDGGAQILCANLTKESDEVVVGRFSIEGPQTVHELLISRPTCRRSPSTTTLLRPYSRVDDVLSATPRGKTCRRLTSHKVYAILEKLERVETVNPEDLVDNRG